MRRILARQAPPVLQENEVLKGFQAPIALWQVRKANKGHEASKGYEAKWDRQDLEGRQGCPWLAPRVQRVLQDQLGLLDPQGHKEPRANKDLQAHRESLVLLGQQAKWVRKVLMDLMEVQEMTEETEEMAQTVRMEL